MNGVASSPHARKRANASRSQSTLSAKPRERGRGFFEQAGILVRIEVDDFDEFVGEIVGRGVQLMGQVKDSDEGRFAGFCDPDGNLFELIEISS